jgi:hypothetical protein
MNGKPLSEPALNLLLNWGTWPSKTPADSIKKQVETYLREIGIAEDEIATVWDNDTPIAGHNYKALGLEARRRSSAPNDSRSSNNWRQRCSRRKPRFISTCRRRPSSTT